MENEGASQNGIGYFIKAEGLAATAEELSENAGSDAEYGDGSAFQTDGRPHEEDHTVL